MRHRKQGRKLGRNAAHRSALLRNLTVALIEHGRIRTTLPKAKELRRFVEPLITFAKQDSPTRRRFVFARLASKGILTKLFTEVALRARHRPGGYTRILKTGFRAGDRAPMAYIEFVDKPDLSPKEEATGKIADKIADPVGPADSATKSDTKQSPPNSLTK